MDDLTRKLTPEQALEVLMRLSDRGGAIRDAVRAEAQDVLREIDLDEIADEVFSVLDSIDVQDCWSRAGGSRDGYTSPEEAADELIEEELRPFSAQAGRYHELGMSAEEATYCSGTILGLYRYAYESTSEFRAWSADIPIERANNLLTEWRERGQNSASNAAMDAFIRTRCPNWAGSVLRTKERK
jgi:hypothetical protein